MNYFELFDIPVSYNLDESRFISAYLRKQSQFHPDAKSRESNQKDSALLNTAYKTLLDPLKRAEYFLSLKNVNAETTFPDVTSKVFELRETYDFLKSSDDKKKFQKDLITQMSKLIESLYVNENNLEEFSKTFSLLRFISSFLEKIDNDADYTNSQ